MITVEDCRARYKAIVNTFIARAGADLGGSVTNLDYVGTGAVFLLLGPLGSGFSVRVEVNRDGVLWSEFEDEGPSVYLYESDTETCAEIYERVLTQLVSETFA